jgi:NAD(P)-dependent dehydrogenase (short-subunit alcohol dehydrogenase family)
MSDDILSGRVAIVTGGASGLGRAIALRLAREGANVTIMSLSEQRVRRHTTELKYFADRSEIEKTRQDIEGLGVSCRSFDGDVSIGKDVEHLVQSTHDAFGRVDILVNNAATNCVHTVLRHDDAAWKRVIDVNLYGAYRCTREVLPHMLRGGWGRIISIASTNAHVGTPEYSAYAASKHGLLGFSRSLALEVADQGITANTISPGIIETPSGAMHLAKWAEREGVPPDELRRRWMENYPQKRFVQPEEVAEMVCYLCRQEARAINGEDIAVTTGASF